MVNNSIYTIGVALDQNQVLDVSHEPVGDGGTVAAFFSKPGAALKATTAAAAWATVVGEVADGFAGLNGSAAKRVISPLSNAGAMTVLPTIPVNAHKVYAAIRKGDLTGAGFGIVKTVNAVAEFLQGLWGAMGESLWSKSAGNVKHFTGAIGDGRGVLKVYQERDRLHNLPEGGELPRLPKLHKAKVEALDAEMAKHTSAFMYHAISFATGFFALVVSPLWGLIIGGVYLIASVVDTVFTQRVEDIRQADVAAVLLQCNGRLLQFA